MRPRTVHTMSERLIYGLLLVYCFLAFVFLLGPTLAVIPMSFSSERWFTYPLPGLSLRWYEDFYESDRWWAALKNSAIIATCSTIIATTLGTLAALGLSRRNVPFSGLIMSILISPLIIPLVIVAVAMYFSFSRVGLVGTYTGLILAHSVLATPFVVITVTATLARFDHSLTRAAANLGASKTTTFRLVTLPLILPGVVSGAVLAFVTSWDEVVVALFLGGPNQRTLPKQMFSGIQEDLSPTITAVASILVLLTFVLLLAIVALRKKQQTPR